MTEATHTQNEKLIIVDEMQTEEGVIHDDSLRYSSAFLADSTDRSVDGTKLKLSSTQVGLRVKWAENLAEVFTFDTPSKFSTHYTVESKFGERTTFKTVIVDKQQNNLRPPTDELWKKVPLFRKKHDNSNDHFDVTEHNGIKRKQPKARIDCSNYQPHRGANRIGTRPKARRN